jgi:hypothetical protein
MDAVDVTTDPPTQHVARVVVHAAERPDAHRAGMLYCVEQLRALQYFIPQRQPHPAA